MKKRDYIIAIKNISKLLENKDIISAYEYGSYKNPGLSDIDLFLVIKNKKNSLLKKIINNLKKKELKFFFEYSTIMIVNESFLKNALLFDDLTLNKIYGKNIKINKYKKYSNLLFLLSILEWLPERTLRLKENIKNFKKVNLRQHLGLLNSLKYTYLKVDKYINNNLINYYCKKINLLRNDKNILKKKNKVLIFSKKILKFSNKLIYRFSRSPSIKSLNVRINGRLEMKFKNNWKIIYSEIKDEKEQNNITVPLVYSLPFAFHLKNSNTLSKILVKKFKMNKNYKIKIKNKKINIILNKRNKLINDNIELLLKNNIFKGLYKFGWFLNKNAKEI